MKELREKALQITRIDPPMFNPRMYALPFSPTVYDSAIGLLRSTDVLSFDIHITENEKAIICGIVHSKVKRSGWYTVTIYCDCHFSNLFGSKEGLFFLSPSFFPLIELITFLHSALQ